MNELDSTTTFRLSRHGIKEHAMHVHERTRSRTGSHRLIGVATAFIISTMPALAEERSIVNEPGGVGVDQNAGQLATSTYGGLLLFTDDRSGANRARVRPMASDGQLAEASVPVEELLEPVHGFRYGSMIDLPSNADAVIGWYTRIESSYVHKIARLDPETGTPSTEGHQVAPYDQVFASEDGNVLLLESMGSALEARILDDDFSMISGPFMIIDESDIEFSNGITRYDVAFRTDGSFLLSWIGTRPPYFDEVKSRLFDASGNPMGPVNIHSMNDELFGTECRVAAGHEDGFAVVWTEDDGTRVQKVDAEGTLDGAASVVSQLAGSSWQPRDISRHSEDAWVVTGRNGMTLVDAESLEAIDEQLWNDGTALNEVRWFGSNATAVEIRRVADASGDLDIVGWRHDFVDGTTELGMMADDVDGAYQTYPSSSMNDAGEKIIAWLDHRHGSNGRIAFQIYDQYGSASGPNRFLTVPGRKVHSPQVAINAGGEFVISWIDVDAQNTGDEKSLKYQRFDADGSSLGASRLIHTESGFLDPIFGAVWTNDHNRRQLLLTDDGQLFSSWGMKVVTGGTIGNPIYGRTDIYTKSFTSSDQIPAQGFNQFQGGRVHALNRSGDASATLYHADTGGNVVRTVEFFTNGASMIPGMLATPAPGFDADLDVDIVTDPQGTSITWREQDDRCHVAQYDPYGTLIASSPIEGENTFSWIGLMQDGSRMVVHGTGQTLFTSLYGTDGQLLSAPALVSDQGDYAIGSTGTPEFEILLDGGSLQLTRQVDSGTDQASEIELTVYEVDIEPCVGADFNCDGAVDGADLARLLGFWGLPDTDLDGDGITTGADLTILLGAWTN
jgi:hypothetical protein